MTMARGKQIFNESVACVCLTIETIFSINAFYMEIGFLMGVMTITFDTYKSLWNSENG